MYEHGGELVDWTVVHKGDVDSPTAAFRLEHLAMRKIVRKMLRPQAMTLAMFPRPLPPPPF